MLKFLSENQNNISSLIAILAFFLSLFQLIRDYCRRKTNVDVKLQNFELHNLPATTNYIILLTISNKSDAPIAITKILLTDDYGKDFSCCLTHKYIAEHYYNKFPETDIPCTERIFSPDFPINLPAHASNMPFIVFSDSSIRLTPDSTIKITVITDKKSRAFEFPVPDCSTSSLSV